MPRLAICVDIGQQRRPSQTGQALPIFLSLTNHKRTWIVDQTGFDANKSTIAENSPGPWSLVRQ